MAKKQGLVGFIGTAILVSTMGVGLVKSCVDNYYNNLPGVIYMVNGKPAIERRFKTNKEFEAYLNSEKGKAEQEYYLNLNQENKI